MPARLVAARVRTAAQAYGTFPLEAASDTYVGTFRLAWDPDPMRSLVEVLVPLGPRGADSGASQLRIHRA